MIAVASDHGGLELKRDIVAYLKDRGLEVMDLGTNASDSVDYPDFGEKLAGMVSRQVVDSGILVCGTGIGMSIVANKFPGVRAALVTDDFTAQMSREHNNANVLVMGGRVLSSRQALKMVGIWLDTPFEAGRHQRRLDKIEELEKRLCGEGSPE